MIVSCEAIGVFASKYRFKLTIFVLEHVEEKQCNPGSTLCTVRAINVTRPGLQTLTLSKLDTNDLGLVAEFLWRPLPDQDRNLAALCLSRTAQM